MGNPEKSVQYGGTNGPAVSARAQVSPGPFQGSDRFVFDSDQVPATERIDVTRQLAGQLFGGLNVIPSSDCGFQACIWALRAGDVVIGSGHITSAKFHVGSTPNAPRNQTGRLRDEEGIFWIYRRGGAAVQHGAIDSLLNSGSAWFMHADVPATSVTEGTHLLTINLPSKALQRAVGHNLHLAPVALARGNPLIQLITGYIDLTNQLPSNADPAMLNAIGKHLTDLVGLALGPTRDAAEQAEKGGVKGARLQAVLRVIESNYTEPEFSVASAAAQLKLSVRYVQDILQETGIGFAERVLELRLQHACDLLSRAHMTNRKVSDIAFSCGFNNLSYFHRAFRRRFGMTPAGARSS